MGKRTPDVSVSCEMQSAVFDECIILILQKGHQTSSHFEGWNLEFGVSEEDIKRSTVSEGTESHIASADDAKRASFLQ